MEIELVDSSVEVLCKLHPSLNAGAFESKLGTLSDQPNQIVVPCSANYVVIGAIKELNARGEPLVEFRANASGGPLRARTILPIRANDISRQAVMMFEEGDLTRPIILGLLYGEHGAERGVNVEVDGERLVLTASREIVLRCGEASVTLTRAGKVLIQGEYVVTRSKGVNRIKGASVQIN
jgi:hypothetical protein